MVLWHGVSDAFCNPGTDVMTHMTDLQITTSPIFLYQNNAK
jgi:hypothetical protein